jgi:hypothetical protein
MLDGLTAPPTVTVLCCLPRRTALLTFIPRHRVRTTYVV